MSDESVFQNLAGRGKNEYLCVFMFDLGNEYLCLRAGWILFRNLILTSSCLIQG